MPKPPTHQSGPPCTLPGLPPQRPPVSLPSMSPSWYASLWTRQGATAFNQPLSLDASSVTNIDYMFMVRLRACPCAHSPIGLASPQLAPRSTPRPPPRPARRPHGMPLLTWQYATAFNQSLSLNTSKVTRMSSVFQVRSARAHATQSPVESSLHVAWAAAPTPSRLLALHIALMVCPPLDSAVGDGVQPAAESRHVQRHEHGLHVLRALRAGPCPPCTSRAFPARYLGCFSHALPPPGPPYRPLSMPPFGLGSRRRRSTSR